MLPKYTNQAFIEIAAQTCFGVIDIIADCFDKEYDRHNDIHEESHSCDSKDFAQLENWHQLSLKRIFTVKVNDEEPAELLTISKQVFCRMKSEFKENYDTFFQGAIGELQKTITIKLYAIELCN